MIEFTQGDVLTADAEALVNTVNCVGVMGRGVALAFKVAFPENFQAYAQACRRRDVAPGRMFVYETRQLTNPHYIINFPTKRHWRGKSRFEDIQSGLAALVEEIGKRKIQSIAIPPLGSGLGGLDWRRVRPLIESTLADLTDVRVVVYEPCEPPEAGPDVIATSAPPLTPARASLVLVMHDYLRAALDPFISLLEVYKLMYFLQVAGEPLQLEFVKAPYGPYSTNLRFLLKTMNHHYVEVDLSAGEKPGAPVELLPAAVEYAARFLDGRSGTLACISRVADLTRGWESPHGLELLATVHWLYAEDGTAAPELLVERTHQWNERKKRFTARQIELARQRLQEQGWLAPRA